MKVCASVHDQFVIGPFNEASKLYVSLTKENLAFKFEIMLTCCYVQKLELWRITHNLWALFNL